MKRTLLLLLAAVLVFGLLPVSAETAVYGPKNAKIGRTCDFVIIFDTSGSMSGKPIEVLRQSAKSVVQSIFELSPKSNIALIEYNTRMTVLQSFTPASQESTLINAINRLGSDGVTSMIPPLKKAHEMCTDRYSRLVAQGTGAYNTHLCVIFMSDGAPTDEYGYLLSDLSGVYRAADDLHRYDYLVVYSVGFFHNIKNGQDRRYCENVLRYIASSDAMLYTAETAESFGEVFYDVMKDVLLTKMIVIRLDSMVEVEVRYGGETLDKNHTRTSFGTLQTEGNTRKRRILRLDPDNEYEITLRCTGSGYTDYTITYRFEDSDDNRSLIGIPINGSMTLYTSTGYADYTEVSTSTGERYRVGKNEKRILNNHADSIASYDGLLAATASSYFENNNPSVAPGNMLDGRKDSSWDSWGEYEGAWIRFTATDGYDYAFNGFTIENGKCERNGNRDYYYKNSRVKDIDVYVDQEYVGSYTLKDDWAPQTVRFNKSYVGKSLTIEIRTVYKGSEYTNSKYGVCVTNVSLW